MSEVSWIPQINKIKAQMQALEEEYQRQINPPATPPEGGGWLDRLGGFFKEMGRSLWRSQPWFINPMNRLPASEREKLYYKQAIKEEYLKRGLAPPSEVEFEGWEQPTGTPSMSPYDPEKHGGGVRFPTISPELRSPSRISEEWLGEQFMPMVASTFTGMPTLGTLKSAAAAGGAGNWLRALFTPRSMGGTSALNLVFTGEGTRDVIENWQDTDALGRAWGVGMNALGALGMADDLRLLRSIPNVPTPRLASSGDIPMSKNPFKAGDKAIYKGKEYTVSRTDTPDYAWLKDEQSGVDFIVNVRRLETPIPKGAKITRLPTKLAKEKEKELKAKSAKETLAKEEASDVDVPERQREIPHDQWGDLAGKWVIDSTDNTTHKVLLDKKDSPIIVLEDYTSSTGTRLRNRNRLRETDAPASAEPTITQPVAQPVVQAVEIQTRLGQCNILCVKSWRG